jgi:hypothetical protein
MEQIKINSFEKLIEFIEREEITIDYAQKLVKNIGPKVFFHYDSKTDLISDIKAYWEVYKDRPIHSRPLIILPTKYAETPFFKGNKRKI